MPELAVELAFPKLKFSRPVEMNAVPDCSNLLFVAEQQGVIQSFPNDPQTSDQKPFLDISAKVYGPHSGGHNEEGLLGLAFHPDYQQNREFFVYYSSQGGPDRAAVDRGAVSGLPRTTRAGPIRTARSGSGSARPTPTATITAAASSSAQTATSTSRWATAAPPTIH